MEDKIIESFLNSFPALKEKYEKDIWNYKKPIPPTRKAAIFDFKEEDPPKYEEASFCAKLMTLASIISSLIKEKTASFHELKEIFVYIEAILEQNNGGEIKDNFEICFFETILNSLSHEGAPYIHLFSDVLGPISRKLCKNNDEFWGTSLLK